MRSRSRVLLVVLLLVLIAILTGLLWLLGVPAVFALLIAAVVVAVSPVARRVA